MSDEQQQPVEETQQPKIVFDLSTVQPVKHIWIERGLKLSCENAGHPHHEAWKRLPIKQ